MRVRTCQVEQLREQRAAGGLALDAGLGHAGRLQHDVAILVIDARGALSQGLRRLRVRKDKTDMSVHSGRQAVFHQLPLLAWAPCPHALQGPSGKYLP